MKRITVCIPIFNEAMNLPVAVKAVKQLFETALSNYECEIIITDNGSTDHSWSVVKELAAKTPNLKAFQFSRNFGYQNSIFAGLTYSSGDAVIELDADLEDPPAVILEFVKKWEEGYDVVYGVRKTRHGPFWLRLLIKVFYKLMTKFSEITIPENSGDFRLIDRKVVDVLKNLPERNLYLRGLVSYLGFKQIGVEYDRDPRISGKSKFNTFNYLVLAIDALTSFSKAPLRLIGVLGFILCGFSMLLAVYYLIGRVLHGTPIAGFTTLVVMILFFSSVNFIFLGVLGEYLSRIFDDAKNRPRVIIANSVNSEHHATVL